VKDWSDVGNVGKRLYAKDLGVRKEIEEFIDVLKKLLDVLLYL
jgi:hypothetical protein